MATIHVDVSNPGGLTSIQAAIDAAVAGDIISVAAGDYDEDLIINEDVTIIGAHFGEAGTDALRDAAGGAGETTIIGTHSITATGAVTIDGVRFVNDATTTGGGALSPTLLIQSGFDRVITNSIFFSTVAGGADGVDDRAIMLPALAGGEVTISDNYFTGASVGAFSTASWGRGIWFDGGGVDLIATGNTFEYVRSGLNLDMSGDSAATVDGNTFATNGSAVNVGVDTEGLQLADNNFENVGTDFSFRGVPTNVTFDADAAIGTLTPANPINDPVVVFGGGGSDQLFGTEGADILDGNNLNPGNADDDLLSGRGGNDLLFGRGGDDTLVGGAGTDTAIYLGFRENFSIGVTSNANGFVTAFVSVTDLQGDQGADTLSEIERVRFVDLALDLNDPVQLLSGSDLIGTFATIQAAIDAAVAGDIISVAAGDYDEDLIINEDVTIIGAHFGEAGTDALRDAAGGAGETTIIGTHSITATGAVTIDGVRFVNDATTTGGGALSPTLLIQSGFDRVITNSIFFSTVAGGADGVDDRAIMLPALAGGEVTISDNYFTGASVGAFSTASWGRGIWFDGGGVDLIATGNTFEYVRSGLNLDMSGDSAATVDGNTFATNGSAVNVGVDTEGLQLADNNFENVGTDFSFRGVPTNVTFDADAAIGTLTPANPISDPVVVFGGDGFDQLLGTDGVDILDGNNLNPGNADDDLLSGRGGNDLLFGRGGDDTLVGGAGTDTAIYLGVRENFSVGVTSNANGFVTAFDSVTDLQGDQGADTLSEIERVRFVDLALDQGTLDLNDPVQLFNSGNDLVGTFGNLQAAVDALQGASTIRTVDGFTYGYDALERLDYTFIQNDDGSSSYTDYDQANANTWAYAFHSYDNQSRPDSAFVQNDDGSSSYTDYDQANANTWAYAFHSYDNQSRPDSAFVQNDDGSSSYTDYDQANANTWAYAFYSYDNQSRLDSAFVQNDDGSYSFTDYDQTNANPWQNVASFFDSQGRLDYQVTPYDDGSSFYTDYDQTNVNPWQYVASAFDSQGSLDYQVALYDDGSSFFTDYPLL